MGRPDPPNATIVVFGGGGFFGRLVVEELLRETTAVVVIASRAPRRPPVAAAESRLLLRTCDLEDPPSILRALEGATVAVHCAGPFQGQPPVVLRACVERRVHYVDVADDRAFALRCEALVPEIERAGIAAFVGCSVVPGISTLLTAFVREEIPDIETVRMSICPGTKHARGAASFRSLLSTLGRAYSIPAAGGTRAVSGWTEPERVEFPRPMGARRVYTVLDVPDYALQPRLFGTRSVTFKIGSEIDALNRALSGLRGIARAAGLRDLGPLVPIGRLLIAAAAPFGTTRGGVMVEVAGTAKGKRRSVALAVLADERGEVIPAVLPAIACRRLLDGDTGLRGIAPLDSWVGRREFVGEMQRRAIRVEFREGGDGRWMPLHPDPADALRRAGSPES